MLIFPWGTQKKADEVVAVKDFGKFQILLKQNAPEGWNGKANNAFIMQNSGVGVRAKFVLR